LIELCDLLGKGKNMNIKSLLLVGILVIIGGAAFVYFDPLDLDLLGLGKGSVPPVAPPRVAASKAAVAPAQAPVATPSSASSPTVTPVKAPPPAATPVVVTPAATSPVATPAQALQPPLKLSKTIKTAKKPSLSGKITVKPTTDKLATSKPERAKNLDLRHCLDLETDKAIAKCAGE
jgi:hypothetical protein